MSRLTSTLPEAVPARSGPDAKAAIPLDQAFQALETYDIGADRGTLLALDEAVRRCLAGPETARKQMEHRLIVVLRTSASGVAKEYVCGKLGLLGSADSVPALGGLLADAKLGDAARGALEAIPSPEAIQALRQALPKLHGLQKAGAIHSLGKRRDVPSVAAMAGLLEHAEPPVVTAALSALGRIGTLEAARVLRQFQPKAPRGLALDAAEACLACAEQLVRDNQPAEARALYECLNRAPQPKHVEHAVRNGMAALRRR